MDIGDTILAKSDQVNAVDLAVPVTVTIEGVDRKSTRLNSSH